MNASPKSYVLRDAMMRDREQIEKCLEEALIEQRHRLEKYPALEPYLDALFKVVMSPGKRIRPLLFAGSFRALSGFEKETLPSHVTQIAVALEVFHAFLLIHDDVIDQSSSRRGEPTLHKHIENLPSIRPRNAECSAIVMGDILQGYVFELLVHESIDGPTQRELVRYFSRMIQLTGAGEALEIHLWDQPIPEVHESWIYSVYELKTAIYTFESPLVLGALLANARGNVMQTIKQASLPIGIAFQIENDLHEISLDFDAFKDVAYDLQCGVKTLYLRRLYPSLSSDDQAFMNSVLSGKLSALEHQRRLHSLLQSEPTFAALKSEIQSLFDKAAKIFNENSHSENEREAFSELYAFISSNRKHSESALRSQAHEASTA
ncbi:MAG: polyprenyl synthetase family protein [Opitutales bacterium]